MKFENPSNLNKKGPSGVENKETLENKIERLWPILEGSYKSYFEDGEPREKAELEVSRLPKKVARLKLYNIWSRAA